MYFERQLFDIIWRNWEDIQEVCGCVDEKACILGSVEVNDVKGQVKVRYCVIVNIKPCLYTILYHTFIKQEHIWIEKTANELHVRETQIGYNQNESKTAAKSALEKEKLYVDCELRDIKGIQSKWTLAKLVRRHCRY